MFTAQVISNYYKFAPVGGMRGWEQTQILFTDVVADLRKNGFTGPWDVYSLIIGKKPVYLVEKIKRHIKENNITGIVLYDYLPDLSDFEDTEGMWEEVQHAIDIVEKETGKRLPLSIVHTTEGELLGIEPDFAEAAFKITRNEIATCGIGEDLRVGFILGEHGFPPGNGEDHIIDVNNRRAAQARR